jgi:hypothetical protein
MRGAPFLRPLPFTPVPEAGELAIRVPPAVKNRHSAWNAHVETRRTDRVPKHPVADVLIGGFATNRQGLITRNSADFRRWFPKLPIREP